MSNCPNCQARNVTLRSAIAHGKIVSGCELCLDTLVRGNEFAAAYKRTQQGRDFAADLVQPFEKDFAKLYGPDKAREHGWTDEALRKWG